MKYTFLFTDVVFPFYLFELRICPQDVSAYLWDICSGQLDVVRILKSAFPLLPFVPKLLNLRHFWSGHPYTFLFNHRHKRLSEDNKDWGFANVDNCWEEGWNRQGVLTIHPTIIRGSCAREDISSTFTRYCPIVMDCNISRAAVGVLDQLDGNGRYKFRIDSPGSSGCCSAQTSTNGKANMLGDQNLIFGEI